MKHQGSLNIALLWLSLLLTAPASATVLTSIRPLAFLAAAITEGVAPVDVLLPDGHSPHHYTLRPSDLRRLQSAELVVWIGPDMETFLAKPLQQMAKQRQLVLSHATTIVPLLRVDSQILGQHHTDLQGSSVVSKNVQSYASHDLHLWLSPVIARQVARLMHERLVVLWPQHKTRLQANLVAFEQQLSQTEQTIRQQLAPLHQYGYFVFHDAYRYFESYFGLQQRGHFTINPMVQPGAQRLYQIRQQLRQPGVMCVFGEPQFNPAVIEVLVRGTQAKIGVLDPLGSRLPVTEGSYVRFLLQLSQQFTDCLGNEPLGPKISGGQ